jgi:hypothetical protein
MSWQPMCLLPTGEPLSVAWGGHRPGKLGVGRDVLPRVGAAGPQRRCQPVSPLTKRGPGRR